MKFNSPRGALRLSRFVSTVLLLALFVAPLAAQQPTPPKSPAQTAARAEAPTFDNLLSTDTYKLYGEIRNVGQLLSNGGAGEIVDPIVKLADPGPQFKAIISFLKKNSESLASSRMMFAGWAVRTDVPTIFVAIEFQNDEDAAKFAPKLETFLPTVLPPVPITPEPMQETETKPGEAAKPGTNPKPSSTVEKPSVRQSPATGPSPQVEERLPFVITHAGNLVCITDKSFKFSKLHPANGKPLFQDQNFRTARDQFSSEPLFFFFNVALEEQNKPRQIAADQKAEAQAEAERARLEEEARPAQTPEATPNATPDATPEEPPPTRIGILTGGPSPSPTPTPTKEEQAQRIASSQIGGMLDAIGFGEPQWPEAVGLAVALEGNQYVLRAIMIDKPEAKKLPLPFVPQLVSGAPFNSDAASVLPDDTEIFVSASIDLKQTYEGMRKAADVKAKADARPLSPLSQTGVLVTQGSSKEPAPDPFAEFEKKAKFNIKDDLLPALGNEVALAGSLKTLQSAGGMNLGIKSPSPSPSDSNKDDPNKKQPEVLPILLIEIKDRDAARALMPKVLNGLGIGEANLIAQTEKRDDTEMVNYAGVFAYGFVGNFLVISEASGVRRVVDAYVNHQTLSSNTVFRNSRRWESNRSVGQIYVSPALMEGYQDEVRKTSATMDTALRDFLLGLNPNAEAITYSLSNDGLGTQHELHLPKNLILMTIAGVSSATKNPPPEQNEMIAIGMLQYFANQETAYKAGAGKGNYGSVQQLVDAKMYPLEAFDKYGYKIDATVMGEQFEAVAMPKEYGKTGKRSFFVDKSGVVRGDDHGGGPATSAGKP
ncbi:MAG TPA: hypothetical protein DC054_16715, partial [Blastocatellia bacterium]|nr:hypothetical protein [Blastocatellia bacterium]